MIIIIIELTIATDLMSSNVYSNVSMCDELSRRFRHVRARQSCSDFYVCVLYRTSVVWRPAWGFTYCAGMGVSGRSSRSIC